MAQRDRGYPEFGSIFDIEPIIMGLWYFSGQAVSTRRLLVPCAFLPSLLLPWLPLSLCTLAHLPPLHLDAPSSHSKHAQVTLPVPHLAQTTTGTVAKKYFLFPFLLFPSSHAHLASHRRPNTRYVYTHITSFTRSSSLSTCFASSVHFSNVYIHLSLRSPSTHLH